MAEAMRLAVDRRPAGVPGRAGCRGAATRSRRRRRQSAPAQPPWTPTQSASTASPVSAPLVTGRGTVASAPTILPMDTTLSAPIGQLLDGRYLVESQIARGGMATVYHGSRHPAGAHCRAQDRPSGAGPRSGVRRAGSSARRDRRPGCPARTSSPSSTRARPATCITSPWSTCPARPCASCSCPRPPAARARRSTSSSGCWPGWRRRTRPASSTATSSRRTCCSAPDTSVKVADFGLARAAAGISHTKTGMLIGTAAYLAPEQVASSSSDERTDVYAAASCCSRC